MSHLKELDYKTDSLLMMEFRQLYSDQGKQFCKERGYMPYFED